MVKRVNSRNRGNRWMECLEEGRILIPPLMLQRLVVRSGGRGIDHLKVETTIANWNWLLFNVTRFEEWYDVWCDSCDNVTKARYVFRRRSISLWCLRKTFCNESNLLSLRLSKSSLRDNFQFDLHLHLFWSHPSRYSLSLLVKLQSHSCHSPYNPFHQKPTSPLSQKVRIPQFHSLSLRWNQGGDDNFHNEWEDLLAPPVESTDVPSWEKLYKKDSNGKTILKDLISRNGVHGFCIARGLVASRVIESFSQCSRSWIASTNWFWSRRNALKGNSTIEFVKYTIWQ